MKFGTKAHFAALRLVPRIPEFSEATFQDEAEAEVAEIIQKMRFEFAAA